MSRRETCRICGSRQLTCFLDLGVTPLANRFLRADQLKEVEPTFALDVFVCRACWLLQIVEVVDPEVLFRDYVYVSGTSDTMRAHFAAFAEMLATRFEIQRDAFVVEIASNDGTFLSNLQGRGLRLLGVEPALNIGALARARGIDTVSEFFGAEVGAKLRSERGAADCIVATNVMAHVDELNGVVDGVRRLLAPEGVFVFENSWARDTLEHLEFDSIYHEHLSYFSVTALTRLFELHDMEIFDVEHQPVHGGSLRVFVKHKTAKHRVTAAPETFRRDEVAAGLTSMPVYEAFARRVYELRDALVQQLRDLRANGKRIAAYGSSAKGNTLLNFMGIDEKLVSYIVDKNPLKQGTFSPGVHLPVYPVERLIEDRPDYALILAWNFADEIVRQQQEFVGGGGRFIVPIPQPRIVPSS